MRLGVCKTFSHSHPRGLTFIRSRCYACPLLLLCSCVYFCLYGPFNYISFHKFSAFSLCSPSFISALFILSTIYLFIKVSLHGQALMEPLAVDWAQNKTQTN